jgi:hypothetical protein
MLSDGDGEKTETAIDIISTDEEYVILNFSGLRASSQADLQDNGHNCDKLIVVDPVYGKKMGMYSV